MTKDEIKAALAKFKALDVEEEYIVCHMLDTLAAAVALLDKQETQQADEGYWKSAFDRLLKEHDALLDKKNKALLLAARWFKLYQEDKTRYEHPASDADLLGMFDAMQEARQSLSSTTADKGDANA